MAGSSTTVPEVRVICGPTAAGKTRAALQCANFADVTVVSADSRQLYRDFDIGTAKPSAGELSAVPHLGIGVLDPTERASAAWWADHADAWIHETIAAGRVPVVVGGTGLYLRALFGELFDEPPMDPARRGALQVALGALPADELRRWVRVLDPARATMGRTQLLRAIEIALLTGRRVSELHAERGRAPRWRARYLLVDPGAVLAERIRGRTHEMFAMGWRSEVCALMQRVPPDAPAWNASGYGVVRALEEGSLTEPEALERVVIETRQYAKRQRTWFRHQLPVADVTPIDPADARFMERLEGWFHGVSA